MKKLFIKNRNGQKISVIIEEAENQNGLAFVMHGLGGFKELPVIETIAKAFSAKSFTIIRFDATNSIGESDGNYEDATTTNYFEDLEDVINWASTQSWYLEPFVLAGHSLGAFCSTFYAEKYPQKIKALAPISTLISGQKSLEIKSKEELLDWERTGYQVRGSSLKPGAVMKLKWSHIADRIKYDITPNIEKLTMPVLLAVGSEDSATPLDHQKEIYALLPGLKELHVVEGAKHTFRDQKHLNQLSDIFSDWIKKIN